MWLLYDYHVSAIAKSAYGSKLRVWHVVVAIKERNFRERYTTAAMISWDRYGIAAAYGSVSEITLQGWVE